MYRFIIKIIDILKREEDYDRISGKYRRRNN
jgi:hypothetical protein